MRLSYWDEKRTWWNKEEDEEEKRYNCNKMMDQSQMCWGSAASGGERASLIPPPASGGWHTCMRTDTHKAKSHICCRGEQQDSTPWHLCLNLGLRGDASRALAKLPERLGEDRRVGGGRRDGRRAHFSRGSWLSRSGGKERADCFASCSSWSRTGLSQCEKGEPGGKKNICGDMATVLHLKEEEHLNLIQFLRW